MKRLLIVLALLLAAMEFIDAFFIEFPVGAIVYGLLLLAGAWWLRSSAGTGPIIFLGILFLLELLLVIFVFGGIETLTDPADWKEWANFAAFTIISLAGTIIAATLLKSGSSARAA